MRSDQRTRIILIALLIGLISVFHYSTKLSSHHLHIIHLGLYYIPIILAGFWFGLRGSLATCAGVTVAVLPFIVMYWEGLSPDDFVRIMEVSHYFMVALVLGILRNREQAQQRSLRFAERLAAMGKAMSGVAHDMRTPLMAIGGFTAQLLAKAGKAEQDPERSAAFIRESKQKLSIVMKETGRLENLVKDMLDFARPLELNRSMEDVNQLINDCLAIVGGVADENRVAVSNQCPADLPLVSLDAVRMKQVLINILTNAIQASSEGETVVIRGRQSGRRIILDVIDRGCGIPPEKKEEVFIPFYTTKKEGTGLGLSIVKKIVEAHQGQAEVFDNPEKGLTFRVIIPVK